MTYDDLAARRRRRNLMRFVSLPLEQRIEELREMRRTGISWRDPEWKPKRGEVE